MLRVIFVGMEIQILEELRSCPVHLIGAYLPPAPYWIRKRLTFLSNFPWLIKKYFRNVACYGQLSDFLVKYNITPLQSPNVNTPEFRQIISRLKPDLGIVANFDQIINESLLSIPKYGFINFHPSLLPRYRGPTPLGHILLNGEKISGITWHRMTKKLDQGDIMAQEIFPVETYYTLDDMLAKSISLAKKTLCTLIKNIEKEQVQSRPQNEADATYFPKLTKEEKRRLESMGKII